MQNKENIIYREVDNRALVLALDCLYRDWMKQFEVDKLLPAARSLAAKLSVAPADGLVEGYYSESEELTEYFQLMRGLQGLNPGANREVLNDSEYRLLARITTSEIFGTQEKPGFLPQRLDCLYFALNETSPRDWNVPLLVEKAHRLSIASDDFSLVGIAAYLKDPVVLAALRETVALYAAIVAGCAPCEQPVIKYVWKVDPELQARVNRFITAFNELTASEIRQAGPENVEYFYAAYMESDIDGRCIYIGYDDSVQPIRRYHWGIKSAASGYFVDEFWSEEIWTTERYRAEGM